MKVRYMLWKNMINRNGWDFRQAELAESLDEPENPGRGWYGIYTFMVEQSIDPGELRWSLRQGESLALVLLDIHAYRSNQEHSQFFYAIQEGCDSSSCI